MWPSDASPNRFPRESVCWSGPLALSPVALGTPPRRQLSPTYKRGDGERREDPGVRREGTREITYAPTPRRAGGGVPGGRTRASGPRSPAEKTGTGPSRTGGPLRTDIDKAWGARCCESRPKRKSTARGTGLVGTRRRPRGERALWARWLSLALKPRSTGVQGRQDHMRFSPQRRGWETEGQVGSSDRATPRD